MVFTFFAFTIFAKKFVILKKIVILSNIFFKQMVTPVTEPYLEILS